MNQEQVIEMAREAGFDVGLQDEIDVGVRPVAKFCMKELQRFAALVAAHERDEDLALCATVADECAAGGNGRGEYIAIYLRDAIRDRGNKEA